ncbi:MAG: hypothetical protein ACPL28_10840 [bacterium]
MIRTRSLTRFAIIVALCSSKCVTPLYEKAEVGNKWIGNAGICYMNLTMAYTSFGDGCAFNPSHHYSNFQIIRSDISGGYAIKNRFSIGARGAFQFNNEDDLKTTNKRYEQFPLFDLGLWSKLNIYNDPTLCFSVKYDMGLNNIVVAGNLYFMLGIKSKGIERFTISLFTHPATSVNFANRITSSGLFLSVHKIPLLNRTVMVGTNFFFNQDLALDKEHYIMIFAGIGM